MSDWREARKRIFGFELKRSTMQGLIKSFWAVRRPCIFGSILLAGIIALLTGCVSAKAYRELEFALNQERSQRLEAQEKLRELQQKLEEGQPESPESMEERLRLQEEVVKLRQAVAKLEEENLRLMESVPGEKGPVVLEFPPELRRRLKLSVNQETGGLILEHEALFGSGSYELTAEGRVLVRNLAAALKVGELAKRRLFIDGHTDSRPIRMNLRLNPDNWVLGARRAAAIARELISAGIEPNRVVIRSFAYTLPLYKERPESPRNRRVEVVLGPPLEQGRE